MTKEIFPNPEDQALYAFQEVIRQLKKAEEQEGKTANLTELNPNELNADDLAIWEKFKEETLTEREFNTYRNNEAKSRASREFAAYIANKINSWEMWPPKDES